MELTMTYQGLTLDQYLKYMGMTRESLKAQNEPEAIRRVKNELVLEAIRKAEGIEPTEEDIEKQIALQAERYGQETEKFKENLNEAQKEYLKDDAAISLVLDLLMKDATILEKKAEEPKAPEAEEAAPAEEAPAEEPPKKARRTRAKKTADAETTEESKETEEN